MQGYQSITSPAAGGSFGKAIAIEDDLVVIGGARSYVNGGWRDVVYLYQRSGALWPTPPSRISLVVSDALGTESFGHALALKNGVLLVGASADSELATGCGAAYILWPGREENGTDAWELIPETAALQRACRRRVRHCCCVVWRALRGGCTRSIGRWCACRCGLCVRPRPRLSRELGRSGLFGTDRCFCWRQIGHGASVAIGPDRIAIGAPQHAISASGTDGSVHVHERVRGMGTYAAYRSLFRWSDQRGRPRGNLLSVPSRAVADRCSMGDKFWGKRRQVPCPRAWSLCMTRVSSALLNKRKAASSFGRIRSLIGCSFQAPGSFPNLRVYDMQGRQLVHDRVNSESAPSMLLA